MRQRSPHGAVGRQTARFRQIAGCLAVGESYVIMLHPSLPFLGVSI